MRLSKLRKFAYLLPTFFAILSFQNCSQVNFQDLEAESVRKIQSDGGAGSLAGSLKINDGKEFTNDLNVQLTLSSEGATEMYVTDDSLCEKQGLWEPYTTERGWVLKELNKATSVYVRFIKTVGDKVESSGCLQAAITHDNSPADLEFLKKPDDFVNDTRADFTVKGMDSSSGVDRYECRIDKEAPQKCDDLFFFEGLTEDAHKVYVRVYDMAGNKSDELEHNWLVDLTNPVVEFINPKPDSVSGTSSAVFKFSAKDLPAPKTGVMSGIKEIYCSLDGGEPEVCLSPVMLSKLPDGPHTFTVHAVDKAGNPSAPITHNWTVDTLASGPFTIIGVTGGSENRIDEWLGTALTPTVHWQSSQGAVRYSVAILSMSEKTICAEKSIAAVDKPSLAFPEASCKLVNGTSYLARVLAYDNIGHPKSAPDFKFTVDVIAPVVAIKTPVISEDHKVIKIDFTISDAISGVESGECVRSLASSQEKTVCTGKTELVYKDLTPGTHSFLISAGDVAGNPMTSPATSFLLKKLKLIETELTVAPPPSKVDILMVIDDSGSMKEEQAELSQRLSAFTSVIGALDWQICMISTDPRLDGNLKVIAGTTDLYAINKNTPDFNNKFVNTVLSFGVKGSGEEQGIYTANQAVLRKDNRCFRADAAFATIILSDEDELSVGWDPTLSKDSQYRLPGKKNLPASLLANVATALGNQKIFTFHSLILKPGDTECMAKSGLHYGARYAELSILTSGIVASKCAANYGTELAAFGKSIIRSLDTISLLCQPEGAFKYTTNPEIRDLISNVKGNKVTFTPGLPPTTQLKMRYYCEVP